MPGNELGRALVIRGGALGDFLLILPVLDALREAHPRAHLEVLAYPGIAALATAGGLVDAARSIEYGPLASFFTRDPELDPQLSEYLASFDVVISYLYDPDKIFADNLRSAGVRMLVEGPPRPAATSHAIDQFAAPLGRLGIPLARRAVILDFAPAPADAPLLAIHPGSGSPSKNWPGACWRKLAEGLLTEAPAMRLAVIGGEADQGPLGALRGLQPSSRVEFLENLSLTALAPRLAGAELYLGHDTGISHLAAVAGVPSLLLFGPTDPGVWAPPHENVRVLRAPDGKLEDLGVATVHRAVSRMLPGSWLASDTSGHNNDRP